MFLLFMTPTLVAFSHPTSAVFLLPRTWRAFPTLFLPRCPPLLLLSNARTNVVPPPPGAPVRGHPRRVVGSTCQLSARRGPWERPPGGVPEAANRRPFFPLRVPRRRPCGAGGALFVAAAAAAAGTATLALPPRPPRSRSVWAWRGRGRAPPPGQRQEGRVNVLRNTILLLCRAEDEEKWISTANVHTCGQPVCYCSSASSKPCDPCAPGPQRMHGSRAGVPMSSS